MKNKHVISFDKNPIVYQRLRELGFSVEEYFLCIHIYEHDKRWQEIQALSVDYSHTDKCYSSFSQTECRSASWLEVSPCWHWEYPQPEDNFGYIEATYDLSDYCWQCAIGAIQKNPFRFKSEPKWGTKNILQLNWVFDEYFVRPEIWEAIFKPFMIDYYPVIHHRTGRTLQTVVQLKVTNIFPIPLHMERYRYQICPICQRIKYYPISCGFMPGMIDRYDALSVGKCQEYFGSGGIAFHLFYISNALYMKAIENNIKGVEFKPVAE